MGSDTTSLSMKDTAESVKISYARLNTKDLHNLLSRPYLTPDSWMWLVANAIQSSALRRETLATIDGLSQVGVDIYSIPGLAELLKRRVLDDWAALADKLDSVSRIALRNFIIRVPETPFWCYTPEFYLAPVLGEQSSKVILVTGGLGSGKTDTSLKYSDLFVKHNPEYRVVCNIELVPPVPEGWKQTGEFSEMLRAAGKAKLEGQMLMVIIDEAGLQLSTHDVATSEWKDFDRFLKLLRKFGCIIIYITQYEQQIPGILRKHHALWINKPEQRKARLVFNEGKLEDIDTTISEWPGVQQTSELKYNTDAIGSLVIDVEVKKLFRAIAKVPAGENQFQIMLDLLDEFLI